MANGQLYQYPITLGTNAGDISHRVTFQALLPQTTTAQDTPGDMVAMYLPPDALKTSYTQGFGDVEMGGIGAAIMAGRGGDAQLPETATQDEPWQSKTLHAPSPAAGVGSSS